MNKSLCHQKLRWIVLCDIALCAWWKSEHGMVPVFFALSAMLYMLCFICYALSDMLYLLCFKCFALSAMLYLLCFIAYALSAILYPHYFMRIALLAKFYEKSYGRTYVHTDIVTSWAAQFIWETFTFLSNPNLIYRL